MIRSAVLDRLRKQAPAAYPDTLGGIGAYGERYEPETRKDFVEAYRDRVWVQRCVNLIRQSFTQVDIKGYKGENEVEEHPLLDLFSRPSPRDPATMFFETTAFWSQTVGEWYWEVIPARGGAISQLHPLKAHLVRVKPGKGGKVAGYTYDPNETGEHIDYEVAEPGTTPKAKSIIAGRFYNPLDDWYGMPPLRGAKDDVISEYYSVRYDHKFFRNSARPDIIIGWRKDLDDRQRKANQEAWQQFKGVDNAHKAAVMDGDPNVFELGKTPQDVQYENGRRLAREGECAAFGVPPILVGDMTRATYSNFKEAEPVFWKITMLPLLSFMAEWANYTIVPFFDGIERIEFDTSEIQALQESENEKVERHKAMVGNLMETPNEARDDLGMDERDEEEADQLHGPMSLVAVTDEEEPPPGLTPGTELPRDANGQVNGDVPPEAMPPEMQEQMRAAAEAAQGG